MNRLNNLLPLAALTTACLLASNSLSAQSSRDLKAVKQEIRKMAHAIEENIGDKNAAETRLGATEQQIATLAKENQQTKKRINKNEQQIKRVNTKLNELSQTSAKLRNDVAVLAKTSYQLGHQPYLKLALSQQNPSNIDRLLTYFRYLARSRTLHITEAAAKQKTLSDSREELELITARLEALRSKQAADTKTLRQREKDRKTELATLNDSLKENKSRLDSLKAKEARLKRLLLGIASAPAKRSVTPNSPARQKKQTQTTPKTNTSKTASSRTSNAKFAQMQKKLRLPVNGKIETRFGQKNRQSGVPSDGLLIAAASESPVQAVYEGQIAYADWFRGFGQLVIVDHGGGFMSLYSHNSRLAVQIGDQVQTGDTIAAVGNTGGLSTPGLYFEIRQDGTPRDPMLWCAL